MSAYYILTTLWVSFIFQHFNLPLISCSRLFGEGFYSFHSAFDAVANPNSVQSAPNKLQSLTRIRSQLINNSTSNRLYILQVANRVGRNGVVPYAYMCKARLLYLQTKVFSQGVDANFDHFFAQVVFDVKRSFTRSGIQPGGSGCKHNCKTCSSLCPILRDLPVH
ncbi:hypothetical protein TcWFU_000905 [Taenia crassiceps]|uniref:Uncharacterized protein n=1 Tax=Taenia crassiceps TaxID=6207 RepID=A0ABR4Q8W6_9CEST